MFEGDKHPTFFLGSPEDFLVTRILGPVGRAYNVVPGHPELVARLAPNASVEEQLQVAESAGSSSMRSLATTRRA